MSKLKTQIRILNFKNLDKFESRISKSETIKNLKSQNLIQDKSQLNHES